MNVKKFECQGKAKGLIASQKCPNCGEIVEMEGDEPYGICDECGTLVVNDRMKCVLWCDKAKECVGEDAYDKIRTASGTISFDMDAFRKFKR